MTVRQLIDFLEEVYRSKGDIDVYVGKADKNGPLINDPGRLVAAGITVEWKPIHGRNPVAYTGVEVCRIYSNSPESFME